MDFLKPEMQIGELLGVPHAAKDPQTFRSELAFDSFEFLLGIRSFIASLDEQLNSPKLLRLTRDKLKKAHKNYTEHLGIMSELLEPLGHKRITVTEYSRYLNRPGAGHKLAEYYNHLCKDWAWGQSEAEAGLSLIQQVTPHLISKKKVLILGAGACRLPYELHRWLKPEQTVCVDLNPLLLSVAQRMIRGENLTLIDFPTVPLDIDSFSVRSELSAPEALTSGLDFLVHDLVEWGFKEKSFDLVVTPWFIDVGPVPIPRLFSQINSVLNDEGHWINFGPLGFDRLRLADSYSLEEVLYLVEKSGFKIDNQKYENVPHLQNPYSTHGRVERTLTFCARKISDCAIVEELNTSNLPVWLEDHSLPIQLPESLTVLQHTLGFSLDLSLKAGVGLSIQELAIVMSEGYQLTPEQIEFLIHNTLQTWLTSESYNPTPNR